MLRTDSPDHQGRWSATSHTPADHAPARCGNCGLPVEGADGSVVFVCAPCGMIHEPKAVGFTMLPVQSASITTRLAVPPDVHYLAVWRLGAPGWERVARAAGGAKGFAYVPAFSLVRPVVRVLGGRLCLAQPNLELSEGLPQQARSRPCLVGATKEPSAAHEGPGFGVVSPVLIGGADARVLARSVHLWVESRSPQELNPTSTEVEFEEGGLVFIPAVWDKRYIHEFSWRLLLSEFDDLVA